MAIDNSVGWGRSWVEGEMRDIYNIVNNKGIFNLFYC